MSAAISVTPASGSITANQTVVRVDITGGSSNDSTAYDSTKYPTEPEIRYHLYFDPPAGGQVRKSAEFAVSSDGKFTFNNFIFDKAGTWTVRLRLADDSDAATASVVVA